MRDDRASDGVFPKDTDSLEHDKQRCRLLTALIFKHSNVKAPRHWPATTFTAAVMFATANTSRMLLYEMKKKDDDEG